jgi:hypothetical protein
MMVHQRFKLIYSHALSNKLLNNNDHLSITMSMQEVCVLTDFNSNDEIPSSDAMISLIMLRKLWLAYHKHTPETLRREIDRILQRKLRN